MGRKFIQRQRSIAREIQQILVLGNGTGGKGKDDRSTNTVARPSIGVSTSGRQGFEQW